MLVSYPQPTCRPDSNFKQNALPATWDSLQATRKRGREEWAARVQRTGARAAMRSASALADAGAAGVVTSLWSQGWGVDKIFGTRATKAPVVDVSCEDYGLLFRLADRKQSPVVRLEAQSEALGEQPVFNTIAEIRGTEKPDEYVMLSAHFDSWDGASGATDNGTGTITMLEAARLLSIAYPKPKRTIIIGHWSGEEQGLNGSRAWAADHPEVVQHLQALFNQDNGTGRIQTISTQGLTGAGALFANWFGKLPTELTADIKLQIPGTPGRRRHRQRQLRLLWRAGIRARLAAVGILHLHLAHQPRHLRQDRVRGGEAERDPGRDAGVSRVGGSAGDAARPACHAGGPRDREGPAMARVHQAGTREHRKPALGARPLEDRQPGDRPLAWGRSSGSPSKDADRMMRNSLLWLSEQQQIFNFVRRNGLAKQFASRFVAGRRSRRLWRRPARSRPRASPPRSTCWVRASRRPRRRRRRVRSTCRWSTRWPRRTTR